MKHATLALTLALTAGLAHADGVPLLSPAPHNKALEQKYMSELEWAGATFPVKINLAAIDSSVITATIEGKDYRFLGTKTALPPFTFTEGGKQTKYDNHATWSGTAGNDQVLLLSRVGPVVGGEFALNGDVYTLMPGGILVKRK